jgi:predicted nucleotidyltransferase
LFALEDLFGRSVDLVEEGCIDNHHVLREVEKQRRPLYAA